MHAYALSIITYGSFDRASSKMSADVTGNLNIVQTHVLMMTMNSTVIGNHKGCVLGGFWGPVTGVFPPLSIKGCQKKKKRKEGKGEGKRKGRKEGATRKEKKTENQHDKRGVIQV